MKMKLSLLSSEFDGKKILKNYELKLKAFEQIL